MLPSLRALRIPLRMPLRIVLVAGCAILATAGVGRAEQPVPAERRPSSRPVEFWTIEPNEGQSSGGHSALRIGDVVYHVEHRGDGLIVDRRDPVEAFERIYRLMGNRSIEVLELDLPESVESALESELRKRYFDRKRRLDELADLEEDVAWLSQAIERGRLEVYAPGLGLIAEGGDGCTGDRTMANRRSRVLRGKPTRWLADRISTARGELRRTLRKATGARPSPSTKRDRAAIQPSGETRAVVESAQRLAAFEAVYECRSPRREFIVALDPGPAQSAVRRGADLVVENGISQSIAEELEANLARLVESERPDTGLAMLLAWSRLDALERTHESASFHVLDPFSEAPDPAPGEMPGVPATWRDALSSVARADLARAVERMRSEPDVPLESRLFRIETARHSLAHARAGDVHRRDASESVLRVTRATRFRGSVIALPWPDGLTLDGLERRRDEIAERLEITRSKLAEDLGYALFTRNCVTELFAALDDALSPNPETAGFARVRTQDIEAPLAFIPVVAGRIARRHLPHSGRRLLPSWRSAAIGARQTSPMTELGLALRESNTLTSRTYHANPHDSVFVFFSHEPVWARPLTGAANFLAGLSATTFGTFMAPFDEGRLAKRGLQGTVMSVPELFFFNVRKGSFVVPPPDDGILDPADESAEARLARRD